MTSCRLAVDDSNEDLPLRLFSNGKRFFFLSIRQDGELPFFPPWRKEDEKRGSVWEVLFFSRIS